MNYTRITDTGHPLFEQAWSLYKKSFPPEERRQLRTQKKIMDNLSYHFELIIDDGSFVGINLWWGFDSLRYIEHLATLPKLRGKGYGRRILDDFTSASAIPVLLEVEYPDHDISRRRIQFYRRAGFILNEYPYTHPPYKKGGNRVSLLLMTHPDAITGNELKYFLEQCHPVIHQFVLNPER